MNKLIGDNAYEQCRVWTNLDGIFLLD